MVAQKEDGIQVKVERTVHVALSTDHMNLQRNLATKVLAGNMAHGHGWPMGERRDGNGGPIGASV